MKTYKSEGILNGVHVSNYTMGGEHWPRSETITFCVRGTHNITENFYHVDVEGSVADNGDIWIEQTDSNGFDYNDFVEACITMVAPSEVFEL